MNNLILDKVNKTFNRVQALQDFSFKINDNELIVVVGNSGSGKTTLLRIIAGLEVQDSGDIIFNNCSFIGVEPQDRGVALVFQNYALYPQLSTYDNITLPLKHLRVEQFKVDKNGNQVLAVDKDKIQEIKNEFASLTKEEKKKKKQIYKTKIKEIKSNPSLPIKEIALLPKNEIDQRVNEVSKFLELDTILNQRASTLSGGQKQRVALAKALVKKPSIILLDEPMSNLDVKLRAQARELIKKVHQQSKAITILVSHDQIDASLGDRVVVLKDGKIEQIGTEDELYDNPSTQFVAEFFGNPHINIIDGHEENKIYNFAFRPEDVILEKPENDNDYICLDVAYDSDALLGQYRVAYYQYNDVKIAYREKFSKKTNFKDYNKIFINKSKILKFNAETGFRVL